MVASLVVVFVATSDPSYAVEEDYYQKAVNWEAEQAQQERNRQLDQARAGLRRISGSLPYRTYMRARGLPGIRQLAERRTRFRETAAQKQREQREIVRSERSERFVNHHRGQ